MKTFHSATEFEGINEEQTFMTKVWMSIQQSQTTLRNTSSGYKVKHCTISDVIGGNMLEGENIVCFVEVPQNLLFVS